MFKTRKGSSHPISKLTEKEVLEIRDLHKIGLSSGNLSRKYKVSVITIRSILRRASWTHI